MKVDLINGSPMKKVLSLSTPIVISNLMHVLYNMADTAWLGVLGKEEVAAMAFVFPVIFLVISIGVGIGLGGSILVSQYEGAGRPQRVSLAAGQTLVLTLLLSVLISVSGLFLSRPLVLRLGASPEVAELAVSYLRIIFSGVILIFAFFIFNAVMRGWGNTRTPMKIMIASNLLNIMLDPLLIFGFWFLPAMGIKGAAFATLISRAAASAAGLFILFKGRNALRIRLKDLLPDYGMLRKILSIGSPAVAEHALKAAGIMILTAIVAGFGTVYTAAFSIGMRVFSVVVMPSLAISFGTSAAAGQNLGAGFPARARSLARDSSVFVFSSLAVLGGFLLMSRYRVASFFIGAGDPEVVAASADFLLRLAVMAPFLGTCITLRGAFKGAGKTFHSMLIGMTGLLGFRVVYAWIAAGIYGSVTGVWDSFVFSGAAELLICVLYFRGSGWSSPVINASARDGDASGFGTDTLT